MTNGDIIRQLNDKQIGEVISTLITVEINKILNNEDHPRTHNEWIEFFTKEFKGFNGD